MHAAQRQSPTPDDMQTRIDRLEGLVLSLVTNGAQPASAATAREVISGNVIATSPETTRNLVYDGQGHGRRAVDEESDTEKVTKSFGIMKVDNQNQKSYYISEAHWMSILHDVRIPTMQRRLKADWRQIAEVKTFWATHKKQIEDQLKKVQAAKSDQDLPGSALIFGAMKPPNRAEIMTSFPSKNTADILITRYFSTFDPSIRAPAPKTQTCIFKD